MGGSRARDGSRGLPVRRTRFTPARLLRFSGLALAGFAVLSVLAVLALRWLDPPFTPLMVLRAVEARASGRPTAIERRLVPLDSVSADLVRAVLAAEDARFLSHRGIDLREVDRARRFNEREHGLRLRGASTITMQCARNVFLWQGRTWLRKGLEVWFTPLLEFLWGKRRILEVYLNVVEWGDGVYGVEAAARHWFGIPAARLDPVRSALLAASLPSPRRATPGRPSPTLREAAARIARRAPRIDVAPLQPLAQGAARAVRTNLTSPPPAAPSPPPSEPSAGVAPAL